ncbi:hypothetical protein A3C19_01755 [Candidatus Kaiserbacteria bacterium RIFCSPHIGHO2_02_FULL_54_22]|uniref:Uncharacterized protein n=1 Tax=Candidatus Kaiserbacteria bacterium RIFCSPHIGHO2_02_FULL_54_22 TaxID=1798495 RepID=A0A1F6DJF7_9BACT|nr:MAG: hypothetical protein A3C19_01755 [Candidatus Kaiserbacteria bacterium RIFCSPHIGHO2_02_FULL_54_22]OGG68562.1 MAG: hypothetical protein A3E99_00265 [Candidatus Kaiserbacteria bacterium RIFCSPHIGHO2_12_FULL_54_16]
MTDHNELFIAYEPWHIEEACARAARGGKVVCLDFLVEQELKKKNISCISLRDVVDAETGEEAWWLLAQDIAREWYRLPAMKFFQYRDIRVGEVVEPIVAEAYLTKLLYYVRIYTALARAYPNARFSIPARPIEGALTDDCLISFEQRAVTDAARMTGLSFNILSKPAASHARPRLANVWKSLLVRVYGVIIGFLPHRGIKIYASEYWSHIGPVMEQMDDIELVLMESEELGHIPWRQLLAHRIRTRHPNDVIRRAEMDKAIKATDGFAEQWETAKKEVAEYLASVRGELDWSPVLEAFEYLITYAPRVIADIDALHRIMKEEKPDIVLQLASVGGRRHHFFLMARVAAQLKIPSLELQHSSAYIDPRVVYSRVETEYLATFGTDTDSWHERMGRARDRLIPVGSTRFDRYVGERARARGKGKQLLTQCGLDATRPVMLVAVPYSAPNLFHFDSYQLAKFFEAVQAVQNAVPDMQVLFKCRNYRFVGSTREYLKRLFRADYAVTGTEDIFALLCASDATVCGRSTIVHQAMLAHTPLILYGWKVFDTYDAQVYAHTLPFVRTTRELVDTATRIFADPLYREELLVRQERFLEGYSFDGRASERIVELIRRLTHRQI